MRRDKQPLWKSTKNIRNKRGDRFLLEERQQENLERVWQFASNLPKNLGDSMSLEGEAEILSSSFFAGNHKQDLFTKDKQSFVANSADKTLANIKDENGKKITPIAGLTAYEIKKYREKFKNGAGDEISYYIPCKSSFFNENGSIRLNKYLVLHHVGFSDANIGDYFNIRKGEFKYFKTKLKKLISNDELELYAKKAFTEWSQLNPVRNEPRLVK